jgi:cob(I)alamin adenosyltransferase
MRITRVYTKAGDKGRTQLVGGRSVSKDHPRIEAYGTVDELNAFVGAARAAALPESVAHSRLDPMLDQIQQDLFNVGTVLATRPDDHWPGMYHVSHQESERLEGWCDTLNAEMTPLEEFILPGGGTFGSSLHLCRVVCRRAERRVVTLVQHESTAAEQCVIYLNRLSDFFFVAARWAGIQLGHPETTWENPNQKLR